MRTALARAGVMVALAWLYSKALMMPAAFLPAICKLYLHLMSHLLRRNMLFLVARQQPEAAASLGR
ncbi:MAG: hypothetical protein NTY94_14710 [Alphaproteobacteria bacterium]|nr:hypothetical protein [Alphaproteobacteria bacterium]